MGYERNAVQPSAQPTSVRTQHLPLPAETARGLGIPGLAGRLAVVPPCVMMCRCAPLHSSGYGHMADGIRPEQAVHRTACPHPLNATWFAQTPFAIIFAAVPVRHTSVRARAPAGESTDMHGHRPWRRVWRGRPGRCLRSPVGPGVPLMTAEAVLASQIRGALVRAGPPKRCGARVSVPPVAGQEHCAARARQEGVQGCWSLGVARAPVMRLLASSSWPSMQWA